MNGRVLNVLLAHQNPDAIEVLMQNWARGFGRENVLLAYGGPAKQFDHLAHEPRIFIDDARLRTNDHQREMQSYNTILARAADWLRDNSADFEFIYLAEYDHLPLIHDLNDRQPSELARQKADVLCHHLLRVDGTSSPHYLHHSFAKDFHQFFESITCRRDPGAIFSMLGTGSFWTREAFEAVARVQEPFPMYLEIYLPTLAHHLGFRLRDYGDQSSFVHASGDRSAEIPAARSKGAWTIHPVKRPRPSEIAK